MKGQLSREPLPHLSPASCLQSLHSMVQSKQRNLKFGVFHGKTLWGLTSRKKKRNNNNNRATDLEQRRLLGFPCVLFICLALNRYGVIMVQVEGTLLELSGPDLQSNSHHTEETRCLLCRTRTGQPLLESTGGRGRHKRNSYNLETLELPLSGGMERAG